MKYSIIISYRDREEHLKYQLPSLMNHFKDKDYEIIICEQNDSEKFKKSILYNVGATLAEGNILVLQDVDHIAYSNVDYFKLENDNLNVYYPVYNVIYVNYDFKQLPLHEIPSGYRTHNYKVHDDHFGGVFICKKDVFLNVGGMCNLFTGWGNEDSSIRDRFLYHNYEIVRAKNPGTFFALPHKDNCPNADDIDFINNQRLEGKIKETLYSNINNMPVYLYEEFRFDNDMYSKVRWVKINIQ